MSDLFGNPEDRFSHVAAPIIIPVVISGSLIEKVLMIYQDPKQVGQMATIAHPRDAIKNAHRSTCNDECETRQHLCRDALLLLRKLAHN